MQERDSMHYNAIFTSREGVIDVREQGWRAEGFEVGV